MGNLNKKQEQQLSGMLGELLASIECGDDHKELRKQVIAMCSILGIDDAGEPVYAAFARPN
jgi:hypothetical protein